MVLLQGQMETLLNTLDTGGLPRYGECMEEIKCVWCGEVYREPLRLVTAPAISPVEAGWATEKLCGDCHIVTFVSKPEKDKG